MRSGDYDQYKTQLHIVAWYDYKANYNKSNLTNLEYRRILMDFCNLVMEEVFNNPDGFKIPYDFGTLQMIGEPPIDALYPWRRAQMKLTRTENYVYALRWLKHNYRCKVRNIYFFKFKTGALIRQKIQQAIKEDRFFDWLKVENHDHIGRLEDFEIGKGVMSDKYKLKKGQGLLKRQNKNKK